VPALVIQGDRDPFGTAQEVRRARGGALVVTVPGGDHSLRRGDLGPACAAIVALLGSLRE
jgi:predicted alpha/beta-hydrolase family hydrolase